MKSFLVAKKNNKHTEEVFGKFSKFEIVDQTKNYLKKIRKTQYTFVYMVWKKF